MSHRERLGRFGILARLPLRQIVLCIALVSTLAASWWAEHAERSERPDGPETSMPAAEAVERHSPVVPAPPLTATGRERPESTTVRATQEDDLPLDLTRLTKRELAGTDVDAFRAKSWYVPPPPPPPEPPPKPTAPPLPFQFMGKTEEVGSGKAMVYLANGNEFHSVTVGEKFSGSYRLERVERGALTIRYLPLSIDQTLPIALSE